MRALNVSSSPSRPSTRHRVIGGRKISIHRLSTLTYQPAAAVVREEGKKRRATVKFCSVINRPSELQQPIAAPPQNSVRRHTTATR